MMDLLYVSAKTGNSVNWIKSSILPASLNFDQAKRRDVHRALGKQGESPAWFNVRTGLLALLVLRS